MGAGSTGGTAKPKLLLDCSRIRDLWMAAISSHAALQLLETPPEFRRTCFLSDKKFPAAKQVQNMSIQPSGKIIVADDHPLFRDALRQAIESMPESYDVAMAGDFDGVLEIINSGLDADLLLLDLKMPGSHGFSGLLRLRAEYPGLPVIIVSATEDMTTIRHAVQAGASGFIPKSTGASDIRNAIATVLEGGIWHPPDFDFDGEEDEEFSALAKRVQSLTPQQNRVLSMLGEGLLNKQIAYELGVSEATVKAHVSAVLTKLEVDSRTQAVIVLGRLGQTSADGDSLAIS